MGKVLLEFKAGIMKVEGKKVKADGRRGRVRVEREEDQMEEEGTETLHVSWTPEEPATPTTTEPELSWLIMKDEALFSPVPGSSSSRVFALVFPLNRSKFF